MRASNLSISECREKERELIAKGYSKTSKSDFAKLDPGEYRITSHHGDMGSLQGPKRYDIEWECLTY